MTQSEAQTVTVTDLNGGEVNGWFHVVSWEIQGASVLVMRQRAARGEDEEVSMVNLAPGWQVVID